MRIRLLPRRRRRRRRRRHDPKREARRKRVNGRLRLAALGVAAVVAALAESDQRLVSECADLIYHLMVLLAAREIRPEQVYAELGARARGFK